MDRLPEFLSPIAARRVASGTYAEPYTVIPVAKILYAFNQSATTLGLIDALWIGSLGFRRGHIYVRTREGVFFVHYRSLTELMERLGPHHFLALNHSVFVNLHQVTSLDVDGKLKRVGVAVNGETEWLIVNRRHLSGVQQIFGLPRRSWKDRKWSTGTA